jgi:hypothetical protein
VEFLRTCQTVEYIEDSRLNTWDIMETPHLRSRVTKLYKVPKTSNYVRKRIRVNILQAWVQRDSIHAGLGYMYLGRQA